MRLLVVEDEKRIADFLCRGLEGAGYAVDAAANGASASRTKNPQPDQRRIRGQRRLRRGLAACPDIGWVELSEAIRLQQDTAANAVRYSGLRAPGVCVDPSR